MEIHRKNKQSTSLNIIIFSKDRACQLDLLLTSMRKMFREFSQYEIIVLYTTTDDSYILGYSKLKEYHDDIIFIKESDFRNDLLNILYSDAYFTVFLVDDIVWKEPFTIQCNEIILLENDPDILCLSLRLDPNLTYCYALDIEMDAPKFDRNLRWDWRGKDGDFGYPMSLDGHIFRTKDITPLLFQLSYSNPNSLEGTLSNHPLKPTKMLCLRKAPIFNTPINKVQTQNNNRHGSIFPEHLNQMFITGYRISLKPLIGIQNRGCHQEVNIILKRSIFNVIKTFLKPFL